MHWFNELPDHLDPSSQDVHLLNQMKTGASGAVEAGWFIDHFPGHGPSLLGHYPGMQPGIGNNTRRAYLKDEPGEGGIFDARKGDRYEFETCAVCADTCTVLGCLSWGIEFDRVYWWIGRFSYRKADAVYSFLLPFKLGSGASASFFAALAKYNDFHGTDYTLK